MSDTNLVLRSIRKALKDMVLEDAERHAFAGWTEKGRALVLEDAQSKETQKEENREKVFAEVRRVKTPNELATLFDSIFTPSVPATELGARRQMPVVPDEDGEADIETNAGRIPAGYEIWELDDLIPSHNPLEQFAKREDYPEKVQERPYHSDSGEQDKVRRNAAQLNPRFLINTNPDAMTGPPVITSSGVVLGGNSRTMSMQLAYASFPDRAAQYKEQLAAKAHKFGFTRRQVESMQKPTLVRVISQPIKTTEELAQASRRFNEVTTQSLKSAAEGVSKSKLISKNSLAILGNDLPEFDSLREFLSSPQSRELLESLLADGVIEQVQLSRVTNEDGLLNSEGKELVENTLRGLIVQDYDVIRKTPASVLDKIDRAIPSLAQLKAKGGEWDISGLVTRSLKQIQKAVNGGFDLKTMPGYFGQGVMVPDPDRSDPGVQAMALTLSAASSKEVAARLSALANDSTKNVTGMGLLMGAAQQPSAEKSFAKAFLRPMANVGGKAIANFNPDRMPGHAAIEWAYNATRSHTVEAAIEALEQLITDPNTSQEEKQLAKERIGHLSSYQGTITLYKPKLGDFFKFNPHEGDRLLKKQGE